LRFGGERFEFINQPAPALRQVFDMVMDSQQVMGDSLFDSDFRQKHQQGWDLLFERLTSAHDNENAELRELQDYRNYLQYDIRIHYPNSDRALLSQINAKKSGGETTTPFYVAMASSFAQAYRLNQARPSDTIRLALFVEAFGKMDTAALRQPCTSCAKRACKSCSPPRPTNQVPSCPSWIVSALSSAKTTHPSSSKLTRVR